MSEPGYIVRVKDGCLRIARHRWFGLGTSKLLKGATQLVNDVEAWTEDPEDVTDGLDMDFDSGVLVDHDNRYVLGYSIYNPLYWSPGLQRLCMPYIRNRWSGWKFEWAFRGDVDFLSYVGWEREEKYGTEPESLDSIHDKVGVIRSYLSKETVEEYRQQAKPFLRIPEPYLETIISVRKDGHINDYSIGSLHNVLSCLLNGPGIIPVLEEYPTVSLPSEVCVQDGAFVDFDGGTVSYWCVNEHGADLGEMKRQWSDWDVTSLQGGFLEQVELTGRPTRTLHLPVEQAYLDLLNEVYYLHKCYSSRKEVLEKHLKLKGSGSLEDLYERIFLVREKPLCSMLFFELLDSLLFTEIN